MHGMRWMILLGACLAAVASSPVAAEDLETLAARAPSQDDYPDADAVVLYEEVALTVHPDGRVDRYTRHVRKYFTPYEIDAYSDPRISFDSARQSLEILQWRTLMRSGTLVEKKDRSFNRVTPDELGKTPDYASIQEMVSTQLGMEEGCVVEREYVVRDTSPRGGPLSGIEFFQSRLPVVEKVVTITVPSGTGLRFAVEGGAAEYSREPSGDGVIHEWAMKSLDGVAPETVRGIERECMPYLVYSTSGDWEDLAGRWRDRIEHCATMTEDLRGELERITRECQDGRDRARAIHRAVCDEVRSVDYGFPLLGTECRPAGVVYETGYGHRLDKAVLLLAWLREAGLEAEAVLVSDGPSLAEEVPAVEQVPDLWIVAWVDGQPLWMDAMRSLRSAAYRDLEGRPYLTLSPDAGLDTVPARSPEQNRCFTRVVGTLGSDGAMEGDVRVKLTGLFSPYYEVSGTGDEAKDFIEALASGWFGGVEVENYNLLDLTEDAVSLGFHFRRDADRDRTGPLAISLPAFARKPTIAGFQEIREARSTPLVLEGAFEAAVEAEIDLGDDTDLLGLPESFSLETPFGSYAVRCRAEDGTVHFERRMEITRRRIEPAEYGQFRQMMLRDRNEARTTLVLGEKEKGKK